MNKQFLTQHDELSGSALANIEKVIVYKDAKLSLWENRDSDFNLSDNEQVIKEGDEYDLTKKISHIPLLIQTLLTPSGKCPHARWPNIRRNLMDLDRDLSNLTKDSALMENKRNREIIEKSSRFISSLMRQPPLDTLTEKTHVYILEVREALEKNCQHAAEFQLNSLHQIMQTWTRKHRIEWQKSRIIVAGSHGPREGFIEMQYLQKMLENAGIKDPKDNWIYYAELLPNGKEIDIKKVLIKEFLAKMELNKIYGESFRGDPKAMAQDLLGKHAPRVLDNLYARKQDRCPMHEVQEKLVKEIQFTL